MLCSNTFNLPSSHHMFYSKLPMHCLDDTIWGALILCSMEHRIHIWLEAKGGKLRKQREKHNVHFNPPGPMMHEINRKKKKFTKDEIDKINSIIRPKKQNRGKLVISADSQ